MRRGLLKDVGMETLLNMRESGMTNQDIATSFDVSYQTILKILGPQPSRSRKSTRPVFESKRVEAQEAMADDRRIVEQHQSEPEKESARLSVLNKHVYLNGLYGRYDVSVVDKSTCVTDKDGCTIKVSQDDITNLISELQTIKRKLDRLSLGIEMW